MKEGWEIKKLKEIGKIQSGNSINAKVKKDRYLNIKEGMPYIATKDVGYDRVINYNNGIKIPFEELDSFRIARKNSVLICAEGGSAGRKIGILERDVCFVNKLFALMPCDLVLGKYIFYWYQSDEFQREFTNNLTGLIGGVSKRKFQSLQIPIPPLSEQKQIVAILDEVFEAIDEAKDNIKKNIENAKELFESHFKRLFSNRDETWVKVTLSELLERNWITSHLDGNHGGDYPRKHEFIEVGVPYISANCLNDGYIDYKKAKYLSQERADRLRKGIAQNNDVLFAHNATVGPTALLETEESKVILGTSLTYYRCNKEFINPRYLLFYMRSKEFTGQYESVMRQSTRNQVPITKQRTFTHIIPPLQMQNEIVSQLEKLNKDIEKMRILEMAKLANLRQLRKSILHEAFTGELIGEKVPI